MFQQVSATTAQHLELIYVPKPDPLMALCFHLHHFDTL